VASETWESSVPIASGNGENTTLTWKQGQIRIVGNARKQGLLTPFEGVIAIHNPRLPHNLPQITVIIPQYGVTSVQPRRMPVKTHNPELRLYDAEFYVERVLMAM
jgi:hypothetical protein